MFRFIKAIFTKAISKYTPVKLYFMNNQVYKVRPEIINLYSNEPYFSHILL